MFFKSLAPTLNHRLSLKPLLYFIVLVLTSLLFSACARAEWVKVKSNTLKDQPKIWRPFVVMKGPRASSGFLSEIELAMQHELGLRDIRPSFVKLTREPAEGEKQWVINQCEKMRCDYVALLFLETKDEAPDSLTIKEKPDQFYFLSSRIINPSTKKLIWESHLDLNPSQVEGVGLSNSIYAEKAIKELLTLWTNADLIAP